MRYGGIRVIGLTGGIATGKSSICEYVREKGVPVIDADLLSREAVGPGSRGLAEILKVFGDGYRTGDGGLDRRRLGALVFSDSDRRRQLEAILHPEIRRLAEERIAAAAGAGARVVFYVAPLLIEAGATDRVDEIWVVTVRPEVQLERLLKRDGLSRDEAERVIASQMPLAEKERHGRIVIDNSGTPEETRRLLDNIWAREIGADHD